MHVSNNFIILWQGTSATRRSSTNPRKTRSLSLCVLMFIIFVGDGRNWWSWTRFTCSITNYSSPFSWQILFSLIFFLDNGITIPASTSIVECLRFKITRILRPSSNTRTLNKLLKKGQHNRWQLVEATSPQLKIQEQHLKTKKLDKLKPILHWAFHPGNSKKRGPLDPDYQLPKQRAWCSTCILSSWRYCSLYT